MTLRELTRKDVVQIRTGDNLGRVDDLEFDAQNARIQALVLYGRPRFWGLLGRDPDVPIPWQDIVNLGSDVILVQTDLPKPAPQAGISLRQRLAQVLGR